ncbi:MAG TPA: DegT/DnrJ/EryC1/StrS family aminotransferase [Chthonomonas sp.]|uniref:DegT/DnrJ/EryC1/StrS family aminotransferase n=1 Tax=Chthonomonas sp. TaxID=2282153 RepID=UPI002B4AC2EA|nr:DegT/DnrJ/EryC1/StrS family aminotransferase [Chthonomonas sp.]HLI48049.1 DegT/DnrJ/EryC1/StrS family aminotransferase [Chthonomonas sp.]
MRVPLVDLRAQYLSLKETIDAAITHVCETACFIDGEAVHKLESEIAALSGARFGIGVASGTDALVLALRACGIGPGDEVITTPFTFGATSEAIMLVGARPVFVDIDLCTFNIDVSRIEQAITPRTRALLPVDLFGQMVDRGQLQEICRRYNLKLIIDAAQAIGAKQRGLRIAETGDATILSFYPTKNLGAFGDGGMVLTNDAEIAATVRRLRVHGQSGYGHYEVIGYTSRLDTLQAAVLLAKLPMLEEWNEGRRQHAALYQTLLADTSVTLPGTEPGNYHVYHQYTIRHPQRDTLQAHLQQHGVDSKVFYPQPLHIQPPYASLGYRLGDFPHAERATREVLSIPVVPELTTEQVEYVAACIRNFLDSN